MLHIANGLGSNRSLHTLDVSENEITNIGFEKFLSVADTLKILNVSKNRIRDSSLLTLGRSVRKGSDLHVINISECDFSCKLFDPQKRTFPCFSPTSSEPTTFKS